MELKVSRAKGISEVSTIDNGSLFICFSFSMHSSVYVRVNGNAARYMLQRGLADVYLQPIVVTTEEDDLFDHTQPVVTHWSVLFNEINFLFSAPL